jgi:hypothetical protein
MVGKLIFLGHTRPIISFTVNVMIRYMHDPRKGYTNALHHILRYLKSAPGKDLIFKKNMHMNIKDYYDSN